LRSRPKAKGWPFNLRLRDGRFNYPEDKRLDKRNPHRSSYPKSVRESLVKVLNLNIDISSISYKLFYKSQ
jgi:hypothetical protein